MSEAPKRIKLSRAKGWRMPPETVKVDRATKWGNPFKVGVDGTAAECVYLHRALLAGNVCLTSKASYDDQIQHRKHVAENISALSGKDLACWCPLDKPCHADVLLRLAND